MNGEWPVLLDIMGKGEGNQRYLSVAEVRTLFVDRRLPDRINARLAPQPQPSRAAVVFGRLAKAAVALVALLGATVVAIAEFPDFVRSVTPAIVGQLLPPALPERPPVKSAHWLDQNWSTEDRHWFHHASQGTATFPVPYAWFVALEQPGIHLITWPGLLGGPALSRAHRLHTKSEIRQRRCGNLAPLWFCEHPRRQDRAGAGGHCRPEADTGG